jgi:hypothetical protein
MIGLKDDIKRYKCSYGYIDRFHYNESNMPPDLKTFGLKEDYHGTAYKLNGSGYWYDSKNFKENFNEYLHFRDQFESNFLWDKSLRETL